MRSESVNLNPVKYHLYLFINFHFFISLFIVKIWTTLFSLIFIAGNHHQQSNISMTGSLFE